MIVQHGLVAVAVGIGLTAAAEVATAASAGHAAKACRPHHLRRSRLQLYDDAQRSDLRSPAVRSRGHCQPRGARHDVVITAVRMAKEATGPTGSPSHRRATMEP